MLGKLLLTVFAATILLVKIELISYTAGPAIATTSSMTDLRQPGLELTLHAGAGLLVLLIPVVLSVYKRQGFAPFGARSRAAAPQ